MIAGSAETDAAEIASAADAARICDILVVCSSILCSLPVSDDASTGGQNAFFANVVKITTRFFGNSR